MGGGCGRDGEKLVRVRAKHWIGLPMELVVGQAIGQGGWSGNEIVFDRYEQMLQRVGVFFTRIGDGHENGPADGSQRDTAWDAVNGGAEACFGEVHDDDDGALGGAGEILESLGEAVGTGGGGAGGRLKKGEQGIQDNKLGVDTENMEIECFEMAWQQAWATEVVAVGEKNSTGVSTGFDQAWQGGGFVVVFVVEEKGIGGLACGCLGRLAGPGGAGAQAGGEVHGQEGFSNAWITEEDMKLLVAEIIWPKPVGEAWCKIGNG